MHWWVRGLSCKPNIYVSWSTSELRVRLPHSETGLSPPVKYFYWPFQGGTSFVEYVISVLFLLCFRARLFIDALWSPAGKGLSSWPRLWSLIVKLLLSHWYPESGVVLDCIDSCSLPYFLLCSRTKSSASGESQTSDPLIWSPFSFLEWVGRCFSAFLLSIPFISFANLLRD